MAHPIALTVRESVALITIDNPPVNAIGAGVPEGIVEALARAAADPTVTAVVVMGAGKTFIAGADISLLEQAAWGNLAAA
jgi:3-hydroxyacyl-CoA dehydrogenase